MTNNLIITIDGPAASGKGTLARALGHRFNFAVLDTGLLYRFVGLACHQAGINPHDETRAGEMARKLAAGLTLAQLDDPVLRGVEASRYASIYSALPSVRDALVDFQREFALHPPSFGDGHHASGAILDGRDCGTVICPDAPLKFYVIADVSERAHRRVADLTARGFPADYEAVLNDLMVRDHRDMTRAAAPTVPAEDAVMIDTTGRNVNEIVEETAATVQRVLGIYPDVAEAEITLHKDGRE